MKTSLLLTLALISFNSLKAQFQKPASNDYHLKLAYGNGTHFVLGGSLHHINKRGFSIAGQLVYESRAANNTPSDFQAQGLFSSKPVVSITSGALLIGKVYEEWTKLVRFDLRAGVNAGIIERPVNFEKKSGVFFFSRSEYYDYSRDKNWFVGLVINPSIDFVLSRVVGLSLGARANINHQDITASYEVGLIIGYLRGKSSQ